MRLKEWGAFVLLGLIWGSSFLWIKLAVAEIGPFMLAAWRLLFGLLGLLLVMRLQGQSFPRDRRMLLDLAVVGVINTAIPFVLIPWGEQYVASSLASILNATVPLFTIFIAHLLLHDEKITTPRVLGLIVGFLGVVVLFSRDLGAEGLTGSVLGQLAVLGASLSYAIGISYARRRVRGLAPVVQSTSTVLVADALLWLAVPLAESPLRWPASQQTWVALIWLGLLGSCLAYLLFFYLINVWGPTRASLVTYIFPVIGLVLGLVFLNEPLDWRLALGSLLIIAGIVVVNLQPRARAAAPALAGPDGAGRT